MIIWNEPAVTFWIWVPLRRELPPGKVTLTVSPLWNWLPFTVTVWLLPLAVGVAGLMESICGVGTVGGTTWEMKSPEGPPKLLSTSTHPVWAGVVKLGLMTIWLLVNEPMLRLGNTCPWVLSRRVTVSPASKPLPLMVKGCAVLEPVTGLGETEEMDGPATLKEKTLEVPPSGLFTR